MKAAAAILALALAGCQGARVEKVEAVVRVESWHQHHARVVAGPRATLRDGSTIHVWAGGQFPVWEPGEPHYSTRAPQEALQIGVEGSVPVWRWR